MAKTKTHRRGFFAEFKKKGLATLGRSVPYIFSRFLIIALVAGTAYLTWSDLTLRSRFESKIWAVPARIYATPTTLYAGLTMSADELEYLLKAAAYQDVHRLRRSGDYLRRGNRFEIYTRAFAYWDDSELARRISLYFSDGRLQNLTDKTGPVALLRLDPPLVGKIFPAHHEDRVPLTLEQFPELLKAGVIAVEDRRFDSHYGLDPRGIARAALVNVKAGEVIQGGSTLTQQLAKNLFLEQYRSWGRKFHEAVLALIIEARYSKAVILEAYLNEIYLGQDGGRAIHGFGLAAEFYFGRALDELELAETAMLIALVKGASYFNPRRHPARAKARRNQVLAILAERNIVALNAARRAQGAPLGLVSRMRQARSPYPAFVQLLRRQLRRDYPEEQLRSAGLRIFSTLEPLSQHYVEQGLARRLKKLESSGRGVAKNLEGAVVVSNPHSGEVVAIVGGRKPGWPGFNRALDARRPVGSLLKPVLYLTALEQGGGYHLASRLQDKPISIVGEQGKLWRPHNADRRSHGTVSLFDALVHSYNLATVRLGMAVGVTALLRRLRQLGLQRQLQPYPSLFLGAAALSPYEVSEIYQPLANSGFRVPPRTIRAVTDAHGQPLQHYALSMGQAASAESTFLLRFALQGVMREGTARAAYPRLSPLPVAGKTGTTDDLRDSWFAGFSGNRLMVVWIGRDDNRPAGLSGARGALAVWADLMPALRPRISHTPPPGPISWHWVDEQGGYRTDPDCPGAVRMPFAAAMPKYQPCAS